MRLKLPHTEDVLGFLEVTTEGSGDARVMPLYALRSSNARHADAI